VLVLPAGIDAVIEAATEVIEYVKSKGKEIRFSCEDSFRSDRTDLLKVCIYLGAQRALRPAVWVRRA
jgi:isopropylmalate/homocitrate/citramalate synthase